MTIGYYVHHQGSGHLTRARSIVGPERDRFTLIGTGLAGRTGAVPALDLADDRSNGDDGFEGRDGAANRPNALHYAPVGHDGVRRRVATLSGWIQTHRPSLMVVDVSVEVAMLARLAATPTLYVRLMGDRTDAAHLDAFRGASAILAPFHAELDDPSTPDWVKARTRYFPGLGRAEVSGEIDENLIVVIFGGGGGEADGEALAAAARQTPDLNWRVLGPMSPIGDPPSNLDWRGWVDNADAEIARAGVVIGSAGDGVVGAVLAAARPFVCVPQTRPFDEQLSKAHALESLGAAVVLTGWPRPGNWPELLQRARQCRSEQHRRLSSGDGADEARRWILAVASRYETTAGVVR